MRLPVRVASLPNESILSFMMRLSHCNFMQLLEVWNYCKNGFFASRSEIPALLYAPQNTMDLSKLSELSGMTVQEILGLSFHNLLVKFNGNEQTPRSRVLMGMLHKEYHYCQDCLREKPYHQILWLIKDVHMCYKHKTQLLYSCIHCKRTISLKDIGYFDICPYCEQKLTDSVYSESIKTISVKEQEWLIHNYIFLNSDNGISISHQDLAMKVLYVLNGFNHVFNQHIVCKALDNNIDKLYNLLKRARNTLKQSIKLSFLLGISQQKGCTLEKLFSMKVPEEFCESIIQKRVHLKYRLKCLAPWCKQNGAFIKTGTHYEINLKGKFKYYLICRKCGCRYGVSYDNELVEMSKFIGIYNYLITRYETRINLMKISAETTYSFGMLRKAVAYFASRGVLSYDNYIVEFRIERLKAILAALQSGETIKSIGCWNIWSSHYEFLYYRYHKEVLDIEISGTKKRETRKPSFNKEKLEEIILPILKDMINEDEDINIKNVCLRARISPTTLRLWEGNPVVASMKVKQLKSRQNSLINALRESIEKYFNDYNSLHVSAATLYNYIGIKRNDLWRLSPDITAEMNERIRKHNKQMKQRKQ